MRNRLTAIIRASILFLTPILIFAGPSPSPESANRGGGGCATPAPRADDNQLRLQREWEEAEAARVEQERQRALARISALEDAGAALAARGDLRGAIAKYSEALTALAEDPSEEIDERIRTRLFDSAARLRDPLEIPEDAERLHVRAMAMVKRSTPETGYHRPIAEFNKAIALAPWWGTAYFNLALTEEQAGHPTAAIRNLKYYLLANPEGEDAKAVKRKIIELEVAAESQTEEAYGVRSSSLPSEDEMPAILGGALRTASASAGPVSLASVDSPPPWKGAPPDPEAYAVVIGIERYRQEGLPAVDFAARDASAMREYLVGAMGFDARNVVMLINEQAAKADLKKYLGTWLANRVTETSRVFIFYAGHGTRSPGTGTAFLLPYDGDPGYPEETAFSVKQLYRNLASLPTRDAVVVLDASFPGQGNRSVQDKGTRPLVTKGDEAGAVGANTTVITAAGGDQLSARLPGGQHGLLTYFLLKGLRGDGDADGDGWVTTRELFGFLGPAVEHEARRQNVAQVPTITPRPADLGEKGARIWVRTR